MTTALTFWEADIRTVILINNMSFISNVQNLSFLNFESGTTRRALQDLFTFSKNFQIYQSYFELPNMASTGDILAEVGKFFGTSRKDQILTLSIDQGLLALVNSLIKFKDFFIPP